MAGDQNGIGGEWRGSYAYRDGRLSVAFEAKFFVMDEQDHFIGTITDDGPLGDADVTGKQDGNTIQFTKFYTSPLTDTTTAPVLYEGILSEDCQSVTGMWTLRGAYFMGVPLMVARGSWQAARVSSDSAENRVTIPTTAWPPPPSADAVPLGIDDREPMMLQRSGRKLTLIKRKSPQMVGQSKGVVLSVVLPLIWLGILVAFIAFAFQKGFLAGFQLWREAIVGCVPVFILSALSYRWVRIYIRGDVYVIDPDQNKIIRNDRWVGAAREINHIQVKASPRAKGDYTIKLVMNDGRKIYLETGAQEAVAHLAGDLGHFLGVSVISKA